MSCWKWTGTRGKDSINGFCPETTEVQIFYYFREIKAHKVILLGASEYFETIFTKDFKEKDLGEITLKEMRFETLKTLIDFIYTGELTLGCSLREAFVAADYLMIDCVMLKLNDYATKVTVDNCIDLYGAHDHLDAKSKETVERFICDNLTKLMTTKEFSSLNMDQLLNIVKKRSTFKVPQADSLLAINGWVLDAPEDRNRHVHHLLSAVAFKVKMEVSRTGFNN